jgi:hypothetical protein
MTHLSVITFIVWKFMPKNILFCYYTFFKCQFKCNDKRDYERRARSALKGGIYTGYGDKNNLI